MTKAAKFAHILFIFFIILLLALIYKDVILGNKLLLPTNYLAHFFSPWSTAVFPGWEQGIPNKPLGTDLLRFFYPQWVSGLKLWNPYIFAGNPVMANFQSAIFYPFSYLPWAWQIIILPLLGSLFCLLFLNSLKLSKPAQFFGAFAFGFSGFIITWSLEAVAVAQAAVWLPLIFYALETKRGVILTLALSFCLLAGYLQVAFYIFALAAFYAWYKKSLRFYLFSCFLSFGLTAVQLLPSYEAFKYSVRPTANISDVFDRYLQSPLHLINAVAPDINGHPGSYNYFGLGSYNETILYIGTVPLVFALSGWQKAKFFLWATLLSLILTSNLPFIKNLLTLPFVPLIPTFQPSRILLLSTFGLSVLAAFGLENLNLKTLRKSALILLIILAGAVIYYKFYLVLPRDFSVVLKNSLLPGIFLSAVLILSFIKNKLVLITAIFFLTIFGQFYFFNKYLALGEKIFLYPDHPVFQYFQSHQPDYSRSLAFGAPISANIPTIKKYYSPEGFDPIFSKRYGQLVHYAKFGDLSDNVSRIEVTLSDKPATEPARLKLLNLLGVKNLAEYDSSRSSWFYSQNSQAFPRVFLADQYLIIPKDIDLINKIFSPDTDLRKTVLLEERPPDNAQFLATGSAEIISYEPTSVTVMTNSPRSSLLFLSDNYYPGWRAMVDGIESKIYRADYSFRSVYLSPGSHQVTFIYDPLTLKIGAIISLGFLLWLLSFLKIKSK